MDNCSLYCNRNNYSIHTGSIDCSNMTNKTSLEDELCSVRRLDMRLKALHFAFHFALEIALGPQTKMLIRLRPVGQGKFGTFQTLSSNRLLDVSLLSLNRINNFWKLIRGSRLGNAPSYYYQRHTGTTRASPHSYSNVLNKFQVHK
jgi:hypothetical protein